MATGDPGRSHVLSFGEAGLSFEMNKLVVLMKRRSSSLLWFTMLAGMAASPALAQIRPMGVAPPAAVKPRAATPVQPAARPPVATAPTKPGTRVGPDAPMPGNPDYKPDQPSAAEAAPLPPPLPPVIWDVPSALELLAYINQIGGEGLNPADYDPAGLQAAIQTGNPAVISPAATQRFNLVSSDLALGHVKKPGRIDWWVVDNDDSAQRTVADPSAICGVKGGARRDPG